MTLGNLGAIQNMDAKLYWVAYRPRFWDEQGFAPPDQMVWKFFWTERGRDKQIAKILNPGGSVIKPVEGYVRGEVPLTALLKPAFAKVIANNAAKKGE